MTTSWDLWATSSQPRLTASWKRTSCSSLRKTRGSSITRRPRSGLSSVTAITLIFGCRWKIRALEEHKVLELLNESFKECAEDFP